MEKIGGNKTQDISHTHTISAHYHTTSGYGTLKSGAPSTNISSSTAITISQMPRTSFRIPHVAQYNECTISGGGYTETRESMSAEGTANNVANSGWHKMSIGEGKGHTHTLSNHTHDVPGHSHGNTGSTSLTTNTGGTSSLSIVQSYITCYYWKRTA